MAFGPRNDRNFTLTMNRKERQKALFCVLSSKVKAKSLVVVKKLEMKEAKNKNNEYYNEYSSTWENYPYSTR